LCDRVVMRLGYHPEDGGSMVLRSGGILPYHYTASQPRKPRLILHCRIWVTIQDLW